MEWGFLDLDRFRLLLFRFHLIFVLRLPHAALASSSSGSGIVEGGSLVGKESANVLSSDFSRTSSGFVAGLSSGSLPLPRCSGSAGVTCGFPFFSLSIRYPLDLAPARMLLLNRWFGPSPRIFPFFLSSTAPRFFGCAAVPIFGSSVALDRLLCSEDFSSMPGRALS